MYFTPLFQFVLLLVIQALALLPPPLAIALKAKTPPKRGLCLPTRLPKVY
jgi:hypothetical protein